MAFQIHYEIAAMGFLLAALVAFCRQKHLNDFRNRLFRFMLVLVLLTGFCDLMKTAALRQGTGIPVFWKKAAVAVYLISAMTYSVSYMSYVLAVMRKLDFLKRRIFLMLAPYFLGAAVCLTAPWTEFVFSFDGRGMLQRGILYYGIYLLSMLYLLVPAIFAVMAGIVLRKWETLWIYGVPVLEILGMVVQALFFPDVFLVYLVNCLIVFWCFLFMQNSDYYLDEVTGFFKMHGFEQVAREQMAYGTEKCYLIIRIMHYRAMAEMYEDFRLSQIQEEIAKFITRECGKGEYYHIAASTFAVVSSSRRESEDIYQVLYEKLPKVWHFDGEEFVHEYTYYIVETPRECDSVEELLQRVSYARSDHKGHHKPGELIHLSHDAVKLAEDRQRVAALIDDAIMDNSIEIYFQPIFSMEKKRVTSLEVLARLKDRDKKFINPEFFIHVAEENRTILQLGEQIYRKACIFAKQNRIFDMGIDDININLSPVQCCHRELADTLIRIANEYDIPMSRMHLEITESGIMDKDEIMDTLEALRSSGAKIALDDFGTGYSSMTSIVKLPVDFVKIDKSLVWSYGRGENHYLNQLVPMIHSEGKRIISEGIETKEHIEIFKELGGDFLQGYYYSKPLSERDFIQYLKETNHVTAV